MNWTVTEKQLLEKDISKNAGGKAREDLRSIFIEMGFKDIEILCPQRERESAVGIKKLIYHFKVAKQWEQSLSILKEGDCLVLQFPVINHTLKLNDVIKKIKGRGIRIYAFIHDLESLRLIENTYYSKRRQWRMKKEEIDELREFNGIVVHNEQMKHLIISKFDIPEEKMHVLGIFDYLISEDYEPDEKVCKVNSCIIAGNLKREKAEYIYSLPEAPVFELYGINYEAEKKQKNINYKGAFLADELPFFLKGKFGLVWDGDSIETCSGAWGEYLKYNNPHKTSLYLACGIPVIIWEEAALSDYVKTNEVGITVKSLNEIEDRLQSITEEEYLRYKRNAIILSEKLRTGFYTKVALKSLGTIC